MENKSTQTGHDYPMIKLMKKVNEIYVILKWKYNIELPELDNSTEFEQLYSQIDIIHDVLAHKTLNNNAAQRRNHWSSKQYNATPGQNQQAKKCKFCDQFGHPSNRCPSQQCYACYEWGHFASNCPDTSCYICQQPGHWTYDCPNMNMDDTQQPPVTIPVTDAHTPVSTEPPRTPELSVPKVSEKKVKDAKNKLKRKLNQD